MRKMHTGKVLFAYFLLFAWAVVIVVRMSTLVRTKGEAYRGNFKDTLTVDDRFFRLDTVYSRGFRGNVFSAEGEMLSTTIPVYDLYWEISKVGVAEEDSAFFMQRVDSLISIFCRLTPKRTRNYYEERVKEGYLDYYRHCSALRRVANGEGSRAVRAKAGQKLKAYKDSLANKFLVVKVSVDELPATWMRRYDWDAIRFLFIRRADERTRTYYGGCRVDERYVHHNVYNDYAASVIGSLNESKRYSGLEGYYAPD